VTTIDTRAEPLGGSILTIEWGPIIAGAIAAAALGFVLDTFAAAIGLSVSSTAPTWRDASIALVLLSGLYLLLAAVIAYGFGGYVAARLRHRVDGVAGEYRDGMHGLLVWALATLLSALVLVAALQAAPHLAAPSGGASAGPSASVAGENIIAYDLDRLFRGGERRGDMTYTRSEAARILLTTSSHRGLQPEDRTYLIRLVSATSGLPAPDAERRVDEVVREAKQNIDRARHSGVLIGFMAGAALLLGAAAAWFAACAGGLHRDGREPIPALLDWERPFTGF
jgi:hypothetical protein